MVHPWRKASVIVKPWQSEPVVAFRQTLWTSRKERETLGSRTNLTDLDACELRWFSGGSLNLVTNPKSLLSYPLCTLRKYSTIMSCSDQLQTPVYNLAPLLWPVPISHAIMPWWSFLGASQPHGRKVSNTSPAFALQGVLPRLVEMQSMHMPGGMMLVRVSRMLRKDFLALSWSVLQIAYLPTDCRRVASGPKSRQRGLQMPQNKNCFMNCKTSAKCLGNRTAVQNGRLVWVETQVPENQRCTEGRNICKYTTTV